jgi:hypothetical protein
LTALDLSGNAIGVGMVDVSEAISYVTSVKSLWLGGNAIDNDLLVQVLLLA